MLGLAGGARGWRGGDAGGSGSAPCTGRRLVVAQPSGLLYLTRLPSTAPPPPPTPPAIPAAPRPPRASWCQTRPSRAAPRIPRRPRAAALRARAGRGEGAHWRHTAGRRRAPHASRRCVGCAAGVDAAAPPLPPGTRPRTEGRLVLHRRRQPAAAAVNVVGGAQQEDALAAAGWGGRYRGEEGEARRRGQGGDLWRGGRRRVRARCGRRHTDRAPPPLTLLRGRLSRTRAP
jgi:hypothetical protein